MNRLLAVAALLGLGHHAWAFEPVEVPDPSVKIANLIHNLEDAQHAVRLSAIRKLGTHGAAAKDAAPALVKVLRGPYKDLGEHAALALARMGPSAMRLLIEALEDAPPICERALSALSGAGSRAQPAVGALVKLLSSRENAARLQAVRILGDLGLASRQAIPALGAVLCNDKEPEVSTRAARALAQIGPDAVAELQKGLSDPAHAVRERSLAALALIGPGAKKALTSVCNCVQDENAEVRSLAAYALGEMGEGAGDAVRELRAALRDEKVPVRRQAALALREIGPAAAAELGEALKEPRLDARLEAVQALAFLDEAAVPYLIRALQNDHPRVRAAAAAALGQIGAPAAKATPALLTAVKDEAQLVQLQAFDAVLRINSRHAEGVLDALSKINDEGRWAGAYVLKQFGPKPRDAVRPLLRTLQDHDPMQRLGAVLALRELGPQAREAVPALQPLLKDPNRMVRLAAGVAVAAVADNKRDHRQAQQDVMDMLQELKRQGEQIDVVQMVQLHVLAMSLPELKPQRTDVRLMFASSFQPPRNMKEAMQQQLLSEIAQRGNSIPALVQGINLSARYDLGFC